MNKAKILLWSLVIFITTFEFDRVTKQYALDNFAPSADGGPGYISHKINQFLSFELVFNRGVTAGMFHTENPLGFLLLSIFVALIALLLAVYTYFRWRQESIIFAESVVLSGAVSNLIDRMLYGGVIDFIVVSFYGWQFPVFNIADTCIVLGVIAIFLMHPFDRSSGRTQDDVE